MQANLIAEKLFRKYYNYYEPNLSETEILKFRSDRFKNDEYWRIWKDYGVFFAFIEGFFHKADGTNQLYKIPDNEKHIFQSPQELTLNFKNSQNLSLYLQNYGIKRMVNQHANNILNACNLMMDEFNSIVPNNLDDLLQFNGYGRKISNMFLNLAMDIPRIAVDIRVFKASLQLGLVDKSYKGKEKNTKAKLEVENILHTIFANSIYLIEMDYLLFSHAGKDSLSP